MPVIHPYRDPAPLREIARAPLWCRLGVHAWRVRWLEDSLEFWQACARCGRRQQVVLGEDLYWFAVEEP